MMIFNDAFENSTVKGTFDLIIADPPYFRKKGDFDKIFRDFDHYMENVRIWANTCKRLLSPNGTLLWYGSAESIAYSQVELSKQFALLNNAVLHKGDFMGMSGREDLRKLATSTERLLVYANTNISVEKQNRQKNLKYVIQSENDVKGAEVLTEYVINKYIQPYLRSVFYVSSYGTSFQKLATKLNVTPQMVRKWFDYPSQPNIPNERRYNQIRQYLTDLVPYSDLRAVYDAKMLEHADIAVKYDNEMRRYYNNEFRLSDVMPYSMNSNEVSKLDFPTPKNLDFTIQLLKTFCRPNGNVLVPFAGSGTECLAAEMLGLNWVGYEIDRNTCKAANKRIEDYQASI